MQVTVEQPEGFIPFDINITIETPAELENLWARLNVAPVKVNALHSGSTNFKADASSYEIWKMLDGMSIRFGMRDR